VPHNLLADLFIRSLNKKLFVPLEIVALELNIALNNWHAFLFPQNASVIHLNSLLKLI
jgi:hypothetical protein